MTRDTRVQLIALVLLAAFLTSSGALAVALSSSAGRAKLTYTDRPEEGQPWEVSVGIAMGAFRGVFVNFLWMRANDMKQEGKYYEAIQLADAITRLQPRFPRVWVFHAWNLAYNISVGTNTREERWQWVNAGINLLRNQGVPANPNDMLIHKELAWIFLHKIGGFTDDANPFYKRQLAREWTIVMGPPPPRGPEDRDRNAIIEKYVAWITPIAEAPDSLEGLYAAQPRARALLDASRSLGITTDLELLTRYEMWRALQRTAQRRVWEQQAGEKTRQFGALVDDPSYAEVWPDVLAYFRRQMLVRRYQMEPARMIAYTREYGPLDWRHHAAHSLYWAQKGVDAAAERKTERNARDFDFINTDRVVAQSVQDLFRSGELYFDFFSSNFPGMYTMWQGVPNPHFVESYQKILDPMRARSWADDGGMRGTTPLSGGYENFLKDAICFFYARGDMRNAEKWRRELLTHRYVNLNDLERRRLWTLPLDEFFENEMREELTRPAIAIQQTAAGLQQAFASGLLGGDPTIFVSGMNYAKRVHRMFFEAQKRRTMVDITTARMEQMPENFQMLAGEQFVGFMSTLGLDDAERVYDAAPDDLRAFAYDMLVERFRPELEEARRAGLGSTLRTFDQMFPQPRALEEVRAAVRAYIESRSRDTTSLERK